MLTSEEYYEFQAYSERRLEQMERYPVPREQLNWPSFLSSTHSCLIGEKGVGKTVLACQKALELAQQRKERVLYASLDDSLFADKSMLDLAEAAARFGVEVLVFDEVHRYPDWQRDLKSIIDRLEIKTLVTGSSILSFANMGGLARRIVKYELMGLSFREYLKMAHGVAAHGLSLDEVCKKPFDASRSLLGLVEKAVNRKMASLWEEYLQRGYYAYSLTHDSLADFLKTLRQATEDTIAYEIVTAQSHSRPDMARKLQAIFKAIAKNVPYTIDYESLKAYAHVADLRTLKHYLACLQQAGIIRALDRLTLKSLRKPEKIYLGNSCLYFAYADLQPDLGSLRETAFLTCLRLANLDVLVHPGRADFAVDDLTFEVGGKNKSKAQIGGLDGAFLVQDVTEPSPDPRRIPLWLFGFLSPN